MFVRITISKIMANGNRALGGSGRRGKELAEYITVKCITGICAVALT